MSLHPKLVEAARAHVADGLEQLPANSQRMFRLMYGRRGGRRSVEDALAMPLAEVVAEISEEGLSWAMTQIDNTPKVSP